MKPRIELSCRLDLWKEPTYLRAVFTGASANNEVLELAKRLRERYPLQEKETHLDWVERCRELIYDHDKSGRPVFHAIAYTINASRLDLEICHLFDILIGGDSDEEISEDVRSSLAYAIICEVPVYPNTDELAPELVKHTRDLYIQGFTAPDGDGERKRLRLVDAPGPEVETVDYFRARTLIRQVSPAELALVREASLREISRRDEAARVLAQLSLAISELTSALSATKRNERQLQGCLEQNAILFGTEYRRIIPKHRLGSEFEMDFALERVSGLVDLVEIEASIHPLFTKNGDPSHFLVHAEQQALDWLDWAEHNHPYAREKLPGLASPVAYVIIGRHSGLEEQGVRRLRRRNLAFGDRLRLLTYDDLLGRARNLEKVLRGDS